MSCNFFFKKGNKPQLVLPYPSNYNFTFYYFTMHSHKFYIYSQRSFYLQSYTILLMVCNKKLIQHISEILSNYSSLINQRSGLTKQVLVIYSVNKFALNVLVLPCSRFVVQGVHGQILRLSNILSMNVQKYDCALSFLITYSNFFNAQAALLKLYRKGGDQLFLFTKGYDNTRNNIKVSQYTIFDKLYFNIFSKEMFI